ncbi:Outer membrane protein assembly factor BamD [Aquicella siphonis]|uniref:Cell division coordinator CpoB n=2 Tax=Aquicella siphonis TaxID=254247 RepID=A0A5E4PFY5_9COXI|nr:Outer membrane protein assembly factor BamD [Aquicella siphonis]
MGMALCLSFAVPVFAESAPVYDADTIQQEMPDEGVPDQYLPPPPPPGQESAGTFVPMGPAQQPASSLSMEQRVQRIEQQVNNMQTSDAASRIESLQNQVQTLRGLVEQLTHELEVMQNQQKAMYSDLDKRIAQGDTGAVKPESRPAAATAEAPSVPGPDATLPSAIGKTSVKSASSKQSAKSSAPVAASTSVGLEKSAGDQPNVAEEQQIYQTAYNLIKAKKYNEAVSALQGMLKKYPSGQFASNAHYWLGELFGLMGKNDQALSEFNTVVQTYPDSPRVSDAQLKVGMILASQFKWPDAKTALKKVVNRYPGSASARLAAEQLKQIKQAGH